VTVVDFAPASAPALPAEGGSAERIVDAALRCVARWGAAKTTLDDVAREAGCGRATLYRLFPGGRDALWDTVVATESHRFFVRLADSAAAAVDLEELLVVLVTDSADALRRHAALQFLLAHEPEAVVSHLAFRRGDQLLRTVAAQVGPLLEPWLAPGDDGDIEEPAARAAEWLARLVISYSASPSEDVDLCHAGSVRGLIRQFVLPGLRPASV
jgi:AcrR family transcriptional regulator